MSHGAAPTLSLIIATYNWPEALALVLAAARRQTRLPLEVLVADDGSRAPTRDLIAREAATFPVPLIHVWHEDTGFRLGAIRNRAIARARGDYIVQIDGDIMLHPGALAAHARHARRGSFVQGSRVLCGESLTRRLLAGEPVPLTPLTPGLGNRINALHLPLLDRLFTGSRDPLRRIRGGHIAFWRDDLLRVNGYDERYEGWGREDSDLTLRLHRFGVQRRNLKFGAVAWHLWHREASRDAVTRNDARLADAIASDIVRAPRGIDQYLGESTATEPLAMPRSTGTAAGARP
ncbi:MAG: glycosyltransferase family 2 protein [Gemmatimonadetes bacterium]|nr:glycosyltransferase family 2 protein [Gemmatimonadota bacterium]